MSGEGEEKQGRERERESRTFRRAARTARSIYTSTCSTVICAETLKSHKRKAAKCVKSECTTGRYPVKAAIRMQEIKEKEQLQLNLA